MRVGGILAGLGNLGKLDKIRKLGSQILFRKTTIVSWILSRCSF